jgi:hypothetical protein
VEKKLDKLEEDSFLPRLNEAYDDVYNLNVEMNAGPEVDEPIIRRAFKWMMCAQENLKLTLLAAAALTNDCGTSDENVNEAYILKICSNFIIQDSRGYA